MIHVINRHCKFSNLSSNKARPSYFSRKNCFINLITTINNNPEVQHHILFDGDMKEHFLSEYFCLNNLTMLNSGSGAKSFVDAINFALQLNCDEEDIIYFVEDDYLHRPNWVNILKEGMSIEDNCWISLYDHKDKYYRVLNSNIKENYKAMYKDLKSEITVTNSCHWRTVASTTDTFAIKAKHLIQYKYPMTYFSSIAPHSLDHDRGIFLTKQGFKLWTPMPGYSTHMEPDYMSPLINWETIQ